MSGLAPYTGQSALNRALAEHNHPTRSWFNDCQMFVRTRFGIGPGYGSAWQAYVNANVRHTSWPPPAAVPLFWYNGGNGHTALSIGDGTCWTTDFVTHGRVNRVRIHDIGPGWLMQYRGWTEDDNEIRVYPGRPVIDISEVIHDAIHGGAPTHGLLLKRALAAEVGQAQMGLQSNTLGPHFRHRYAKLQHKWYGKGDGIPGPASLTRLCNMHNLDPRP